MKRTAGCSDKKKKNQTHQTVALKKTTAAAQKKKKPSSPRKSKILRRVSENVLSGTAKLPVHTTRRRPSTRGWVIAQTLARRWLELLG